MDTIRRGEVLVVDDDQDLRDTLGVVLSVAGFAVTSASTGEAALDLVCARVFDVALVDLQLPALRGSTVIEQARALQPDLEAVVITGHNTFAAAVEALRAGAYDFIEKPFSNDHLVRVIGHAVERRRLRVTAREHREHIQALSTLHAVAHASGSSLVVDEILDAALAVTVERLGADAAAVGLLDESGESYTFARALALESEVSSFARGISVAEPMAAAVFATGTTVEMVDLASAPGQAAAVFARAGYASAWLVPVASAGRSLGALLATWRSPRCSTEGELALFRAIGEELGPPIQNARIHAQAQHHAARLRAIHDLVRAINSEHDLDAVLGLLASHATRLVGASEGTVMLPTEDGVGLRMQAVYGPGWRSSVGTVSPIVGSLNGLVFRAGHPLVTLDIRTDPRLFPAMRAVIPAGACAVVPLLHRGAPVGTLAVIDGKHPGRSFSDDDLSLLGLLADHAAIAIDNARMHARERAQTAMLEARVTERTRALSDAQEQLVRRERLAILGRMAGSVSHEIRNPLGVLRNSLYFLRMVRPPGADPGTDEEILRHVEVMETEVDRANRIVGDLLDYARVRTPVLRPVSLPAVLARALAGAPLPPGVSVTRDFAPDAPYAQADGDQLLTVFGNLVRNALQAMAHGGTLTLRVSADRDGVVAEVTDTGPGLAMEVRDRLFEPLVTTKTKGLGLGLATAKNLVEIQHGSLSGENAPGQGARFRVRLPAATAGPTIPRTAASH